MGTTLTPRSMNAPMLNSSTPIDIYSLSERGMHATSYMLPHIVGYAADGGVMEQNAAAAMAARRSSSDDDLLALTGSRADPSMAGERAVKEKQLVAKMSAEGFSPQQIKKERRLLGVRAASPGRVTSRGYSRGQSMSRGMCLESAEDLPLAEG